MKSSTVSENTPNLATLQTQIERVFVGKKDVVERALAAFLAGGHLLLEDVPGVGKTTLALSLARSIGGSFQRIQFTSDLMPSDILGVSVLHPKTQEFEFKKGPVFHQVILADELNRATPRTQSALLEAMNEHQVTVDNETHALPKPFFVIATQNPHEHHGVFPLPESQLDRFMMRLSIGYPDLESERAILKEEFDIDALQTLAPCVSMMEMLEFMSRVPTITVAPEIDTYILALVRATRQTASIAVGASPRGALALRRAAQAYAFLRQRSYVTPDDIKALAVSVLAHRLVLASDAMTDPRAEAERAIHHLLETTRVPL